MGDAHTRLMLAIAASGALHLALIYGVTVRAPVPPASLVVARLQREAPGLDALPAATAASARPARASPLASAAPPVKQGASLISPARSALTQPAELRGPVPPPAPPPDSALPSVVMPLLADPAWYQAQELDLYPRALGPVEPAYPVHAAQEGIGGEVTLVLKVDESGTVQEVAVTQAAPEGYFEAAASAAFRTARFTPAQKDGRSVRSRVVVRVSFDPRQERGERSPERREDTKTGEAMLESGPR